MKVSTLTVGVGGTYFVCVGMTVPRETDKLLFHAFLFVLLSKQENKGYAMISIISANFRILRYDLFIHNFIAKNAMISLVIQNALIKHFNTLTNPYIFWYYSFCKIDLQLLTKPNIRIGSYFLNFRLQLLTKLNILQTIY